MAREVLHTAVAEHLAGSEPSFAWVANLVQVFSSACCQKQDQTDEAHHKRLSELAWLRRGI